MWFHYIDYCYLDSVRARANMLRSKRIQRHGKTKALHMGTNTDLIDRSGENRS